MAVRPRRALARLIVALPWATHAFEFNLHGPGGQIGTYAIEWFLQVVTGRVPSPQALTASVRGEIKALWNRWRASSSGGMRL